MTMMNNNNKNQRKKFKKQKEKIQKNMMMINYEDNIFITYSFDSFNSFIKRETVSTNIYKPYIIVCNFIKLYSNTYLLSFYQSLKLKFHLTIN